MRHLTLIGLMFALISITPASVLVCGSVLTPELILQLNDGHDFAIEIACTPQPSTLFVSTNDFSAFVQNGFFAVTAILLFAAVGLYWLWQSQSQKITGWVIAPPTPPPTSSFS